MTSDHLRFCIARDQFCWHEPIAKATGDPWTVAAAEAWLGDGLRRTEEGREWVKNLPRLRPPVKLQREIERRKNWWRGLGWVCAVVGRD